MSLYHLIRQDSRAAIVEPSGRSIRFDELQSSATAVGGLFHERVGVGGGVLLIQPMGIDLYRMVCGLFAAGATGVIVDPAAGLSRVRESLRQVGVRGLAGPWWAQLARVLIPELRGTQGFSALGGFGAIGLPQRVVAPLPQHVPEQTPALITFTTGSTGRPKAMARSHAFLATQHAVLQAHLQLTPDDVDLATLPVFALSSLASGATVVIPDCNLRRPASVNPARVLRQMRERRVTTITASPAFLLPLAQFLLSQGDTFPGLRGCFTGGARVSAATGNTLLRAFPRARVEVVYGSTEAEPMATLDLREHIHTLAQGELEGRGVLVGRPVSGIELRIIDPNTREAAEVGEVVVCGAHVNRSYFEDPEADRLNKIADGERIWHRTGDTGRLDDQGRLWMLGRVADMVHGVHPFPIEMAAERISGVGRSALIWDERKGQSVLFYEGSVEAAAPLAALAPGAKVVRIAAVPVDARHNAKVNRMALRARLAAEH